MQRHYPLGATRTPPEGRRRVRGRASKESKASRAARQRLELACFVQQLRKAGNVVDTEVRFDSRPQDKKARPKIPRAWRFDVAMPSIDPLGGRGNFQNIAIEIEGLGGRHQTMGGFVNDLLKYQEAFAQNWNVVRFTRRQIGNGEAMKVLERAGVRVEGK